MSKITIVEGNSNDKDNVRVFMVKGEKGDTGDVNIEQLNTEISNRATADNNLQNQINVINSTKANTSDIVNTYETKTGHNNDISALNSQISSLASGSPLVASSVSEMADTSRVYVNTTDGHWYYYSNNQWNDGGVYQATEDSTSILELKNVVDNITDITFIQENHTIESGFINTNNTIDTSFGKHIIVDVTTGETIQFSCSASSNLRAYLLRDSSHNIVSMSPQVPSGTNYNHETVVIPSGVSEIVINTSYTPSLAFYRSNIKVPYETIEIPEHSITKNKLEEFISNLFINKYEAIETTINNNHFIATNGEIANVNDTNYAEVEVRKGEKYEITAKHGQNLKLYVLKDSNYNVIKYYPTSQISQQITETISLEIPENGYLYVNTFNPSSVMLINKLIGYEINSDSNPLMNKKVLFFGDSITAGDGSWAQPSTIMNKNKMTGSNCGVGGMTYTVTSTSNSSNNIYLRMQDKASEENVDYVIFQGGVNDAFRGYDVGNMSSLSDFTSNLDTSNFSGAFEMAVRFVLTNWKGAKVGFIANAKIPRNSNLGLYMDRAKEICHKYSVPVLDFYNESGLCAGIQSINDTYYLIDSDYSTEHSGGTHPTSEGYAKYLNNKVESFMKYL